MSTESYLSEADLHAILGRALIDHTFRDRLIDPSTQKEALEEMGVRPTDEMLRALNASIDSLSSLTATFGAKQAAT